MKSIDSMAPAQTIQTIYLRLNQLKELCSMFDGQTTTCRKFLKTTQSNGTIQRRVSECQNKTSND